eukprot:CAMPEP_0198546006 /NCGR_PEP_ID=MMETSP1462-20131121/65957_1 /TAXON_ID=1333877 /ORGANISM="Brandtodinium nutriculum, Strain RCC3387" /LENGTH=83 /DNA_ID=CAMNT_0044276429 /DNA_START=36 /DNA_END=283 /DNA_ORIENTATION=+
MARHLGSYAFLPLQEEAADAGASPPAWRQQGGAGQIAKEARSTPSGGCRRAAPHRWRGVAAGAARPREEVTPPGPGRRGGRAR